MSKFWNKPCYECDAKKSISLGFLCDYKMYGSGNSFDVSKYKKLKRELTSRELSDIAKQDKIDKQISEIIFICEKENRKKVAIIAANIEHAERLHEKISKTKSAVVIHSKLKNANDLIEEYKNNDVVYSISVAMIQEGFDCPKLDCVVFLVATRSARKMIQIIGRGLRLFPGKDYCLVLDFAFVILNCGDPKNPIIIADNKSEKTEGIIYQCEMCFFMQEQPGKCLNCGHIKTPEKRDVEKNLKTSVFEDNVTVRCERHHLWKNSKTKKGSPFITVKRHGVFISIFGFQTKQFWAAKYPKVLGIRAFVKPE